MAGVDDPAADSDRADHARGVRARRRRRRARRRRAGQRRQRVRVRGGVPRPASRVELARAFLVVAVGSARARRGGPRLQRERARAARLLARVRRHRVRGLEQPPVAAAGRTGRAAARPDPALARGAAPRRRGSRSRPGSRARSTTCWRTRLPASRSSSRRRARWSSRAPIARHDPGAGPARPRARARGPRGDPAGGRGAAWRSGVGAGGDRGARGRVPRDRRRAGRADGRRRPGPPRRPDRAGRAAGRAGGADQRAQARSRRRRVGRRARRRAMPDDDVVLLRARTGVLDESGAAVPAGLADTGGGYGLQGMRERAALLGGTLDAGAVDGEGWRVELRLPAARELGGRPSRGARRERSRARAGGRRPGARARGADDAARGRARHHAGGRRRRRRGGGGAVARATVRTSC